VPPLLVYSWLPTLLVIYLTFFLMKFFFYINNIGLEMVGASKRMVAGTVCQMFFSVGYMLTAVFAIYITDWRPLQFALTIPGLVFLTYWW